MTQPQDLPPQARIIQIVESFWLGRAVGAAARLGLPDALADGPKTVEELAKATQTHAPSLGRLVRALVAYGIFCSEGGAADGGAAGLGHIGLTELSETLITDRPGSMRMLALTLLGTEHYTAWGELEHTVRTGETAFDHHYGMDPWTYFRQNPDRGEEFNRTMVAATAATNQAIMEVCDFRAFSHIVDVGGGHGSLLRVALEQNTAARGTVFDQPEVIAEARAAVEEAGLADRVNLVGGSFFESVPEGGDAYLLKYILHDWDDEKCLTILKNVRKAIAPRGTLMVFDTVVPPADKPDFSMLMDLNMLAMTGGRERTEQELADLLARGGFKLRRIVPTQSHIAIAEADPA